MEEYVRLLYLDVCFLYLYVHMRVFEIFLIS